MDDDEDAPEILFWLLPSLVGLAALLCFGISFLTKRWWQRLLLWALALLLAAGAALLLVRSHPRMAQRLPFAPTPANTHTTENDLAQNINSAEAEKSCCPWHCWGR